MKYVGVYLYTNMQIGYENKPTLACQNLEHMNVKGTSSCHSETQRMGKRVAHKPICIIKNKQDNGRQKGNAIKQSVAQPD